MKKIILSLAIAAIAFSAGAQTVKVPASWGVRAGLNLSTYAAKENPDNFSYALKPGFYVGAFAEWENIVDYFGLRVEANVSTLGEKYSVASDHLKATSNSVNLLIPVMAQYGFIDGRLNVMAGPQLGFCFGGADTIKSDFDTVKTSWKSDHFKTVDFAIVFGADFMLTTKIGVEARYNLGLTPTLVGRGNSSRNRALSIGVFYQF